MVQEKIISFFYLKLFFLFVIVLIIGALLFKLGFEITQSSFKNNSFSLLYVSKDSKVIYVDKKEGSALFLAVGNIQSIVKGKSPLEASIALGIPINAIIIDTNWSPQNIRDFTNSNNELRLLTSGDSIHFKNLDLYDIFKLVNALRSINTDNRHEVRVNLFNPDEVKEKIGTGFNDSVISASPLTIEIDNGTTVNGLGSDMALILAKLGYNVIAVRNGTQDSSSYVASTHIDNASVNSLADLTRFPFKKESISASADITLYLGVDLDAQLSQ